MEEITMGKPVYKIKVILIGLLFICIGGLLLASNLGFVSINLKEYVFTWQSLLIVIGLISLTKREGIPFGSVLILVGGFFLLRKYVDLPVNFHQIFWPALIMATGVIIVLSRIIFKPRTCKYRNGLGGEFTNEEYMDDVAIFGGLERTIISKKFKGGKSVAIFGGSKINLLDTKLDEGIHVLEMIAIFGGAQYLIPSDWNVKIDVVSIFGGFADKRFINEGQVDQSRQLIIKGIAFFGGGEIKSTPN